MTDQPAKKTAPAPADLDPNDRYTVFTTPDGREALLVLTGGDNTGYTPMTRPDGTVRIGYLNPDGTEAGMLNTEYTWLPRTDLTPTRRLP